MKQLHPRAVWLFFFNAITVWIVFAVAFGSYDAFLLKWARLSILFFSLLAVMVFYFIWAKLTYHYYRYELTENVFKKEHGIIWKKYVSIPYDRIQNIDIHRGLIARLLGLSDLQIQTAGGITAGSYGAFSEGRLPGLSHEEAERIRDELINRSRHHKNKDGI